jgi:hypothetical protein
MHYLIIYVCTLQPSTVGVVRFEYMLVYYTEFAHSASASSSSPTAAASLEAAVSVSATTNSLNEISPVPSVSSAAKISSEDVPCSATLHGECSRIVQWSGAHLHTSAVVQRRRRDAPSSVSGRQTLHFHQVQPAAPPA